MKGRLDLHHGDCRRILPGLADKSVDVVFVDPPYGMAYQSHFNEGAARRFRKIAADGGLNEALPILKSVLSEARRVLKPAGVLYLFAPPLSLDRFLPLARSWFDVANLLCWDKGNWTAGDLESTYGRQWEAVLFCRKRRSKMLSKRSGDVVRVSRGDVGKYTHPTQKPTALYRRLLLPHRRDVVLDPFMGSATSGLAALSLGSSFVGVEVDAEYFRSAERRLRAAAAKGPLTKGKD